MIGLNEVNIESNYSFIEGFLIGDLHRNKELKVFDWDKFTEYLLTQDEFPDSIKIGLNGDFDFTSTQAISNKKINEIPSVQMWLSSTHCIPCFAINDNICYECWIVESETDYNMGTFWPEHCIVKLVEKFGKFIYE